MKAVSAAMGMSDGWLSDTLKDDASPRVDHFVRLAAELGVQPGYLLSANDDFRITVPVVGIVSGGEGWMPVDEGHPPERVEFTLGDRDPIALEVRGDSMAPVYRDGDMLFCHRQTANLGNLIGLDCVVLTEAGETFIKILDKGARPGLYDLRPYNYSAKTLKDQKIRWAAAVRWVRRAW